jgi:hypothetical protein
MAKFLMSCSALNDNKPGLFIRIETLLQERSLLSDGQKSPDKSGSYFNGLA